MYWHPWFSAEPRVPIIEVTESESKKVFTGKRTATKDEMIVKAMELYPDANWPYHQGSLSATKAEHMADAISAIHAGVLSQLIPIHHASLRKGIMQITINQTKSSRNQGPSARSTSRKADIVSNEGPW